MNTDKKNQPQSIIKLLQKKHSSLADLYKKANSIQEIDHKLKKYLDPSLQDKFQLANIEPDVATLIVNSSAWATRLRYNIPTILNLLNNNLNFTAIKTVRIKIKKSILEIKSDSNNKPIHLSDNSAQFLNDVANSFSDPSLRACILKISKNRLK